MMVSILPGMTVEQAHALRDALQHSLDAANPVNQEIADQPERVNQDPYAAWMFRLKPSAPGELEALLDAAGYDKVAAEDKH